jgi:hypothetical protein
MVFFNIKAIFRTHIGESDDQHRIEPDALTHDIPCVEKYWTKSVERVEDVVVMNESTMGRDRDISKQNSDCS